MTAEPTSALPRGRVTFVITDIEGSTGLLRRLGDDFRSLMFRHRELVSEATRAHGGHVVGHEGDACFCVFTDAAGAICACLQAQAAIDAQAWPQDVRLAIRVGVHTGEAEPYGDSYISLAVHQTARVSAAGHGGQVLVSTATGEAAAGRLPDGCSLRDLGSFRLKDFPQPERLLQLCHPGLRSEFPLPRTLSVRGHNLPRSATSFIGRVDERARLGQLLRERSLVTAVGPGGVGKTRLALEVGGDLLPFFGDGVWLVELAPAHDDETAIRACAYALGIAEEGERPLLDSIAAYLESRSVLLILDNCEHLLAIAARIAGTLAAAAGVRVLATSREPLYLSGEQVLRMDPLATQGEGGELSEAARLLVERIHSHRADFTLDSRTAESVGEICRRLDGMPLALELAASRARALPVGEIALRLKDRFRLLSGSARDTGSRHRTLRATVEWSYETLSASERLLFDRLAVFADGWDLAAAEAVCAGDGLPVEDMADLLTALVDKSLVTYRLGFPASDDHRYGMLETLREFAREKLHAGDSLGVQRGLLAWALTMARNAVPRITGAQGPQWMQRLVLEQDNLRAALDIGHRLGAHDPTIRLTTALAHFWIKRGRLQEGIEWTQRAEALPSDDPQARAHLLIALGRLLRGSEPARVESLLREALRLAIQMNDVQTRVEALKQLTTCARDRGDYAAAETLLLEQSQILAGVDDPYRRFVVDTELATLMLQQSRYAEAVPRLRERLAEAELRGWRFDRARLSNNLAVGLIEIGEYDEALRLATAGADTFRELGSLEGVAHVLSTAGLALLRKGDIAQARRNFVEVGRISLEVGASHLAPEALERLAAVEIQTAGNEPLAARYAFAADALYAEVGYEREPADKALRDELQARLEGCLDGDLLCRIRSYAMLQARDVLSEAVGARTP
ncbi:hypothetical protein B1810_16890 [Panacagrimonas perspica]|nr:adenylate/guanylate cyclase domain-containing protein [Panacagrimonas perspica]THD02141.1 hypothetical protein B1810_16890 [Panacagrimonas perspica]